MRIWYYTMKSWYCIIICTYYLFLNKRICVLIAIDQNVKLISQTWLYENFNKRKSINKLIDVFFKKKMQTL